MHFFFQLFMGRRVVHIVDDRAHTHEELGFRSMAGFISLPVPVQSVEIDVLPCVRSGFRHVYVAGAVNVFCQEVDETLMEVFVFGNFSVVFHNDGCPIAEEFFCQPFIHVMHMIDMPVEICFISVCSHEKGNTRPCLLPDQGKGVVSFKINAVKYRACRMQVESAEHGSLGF